MVLFKPLRARIHHFLLSRKLKNTLREHKVCNYEQAKSIAILFDGSKPEIMEPVKMYHQELRNLNKKVYLLGYIHKPRAGEAVMFDHFTRHDLNWWFIPKPPKINEFVNQKFDILINLCTDECLPLEYLSALSNADYRVGRYLHNKTFCFDLMIKTNGKRDITFLIQQIGHYLTMVK